MALYPHSPICLPGTDKNNFTFFIYLVILYNFNSHHSLMTETGQDQETFAFNLKLTKLVHQEDFIMFCDFESYKF